MTFSLGLTQMKGVLATYNTMKDLSNGILDRFMVLVPDCKKPEDEATEEGHKSRSAETNIAISDLYARIVELIGGNKMILKFSTLART